MRETSSKPLGKPLNEVKVDAGGVNSYVLFLKIIIHLTFVHRLFRGIANNNQTNYM